MLELIYLFAGYYAIHTVIFFVTLAMYASLLKRRNIVYKFIGGGVRVYPVATVEKMDM